MYPYPHSPRPPRVMHPRLVAHLRKSNSLARLLRDLGVGVRRVDLSQERPVLHVTDNVLNAVPLGGVMRLRTASDTVTCSATLDGCTVMWSEWAH